VTIDEWIAALHALAAQGLIAVEADEQARGRVASPSHSGTSSLQEILN
jgi:hypothetical protein